MIEEFPEPVIRELSTFFAERTSSSGNRSATLNRPKALLFPREIASGA